MKLAELIDRLDRSRDEKADPSQIAEQFGLVVDYGVAHGFVECPYKQWLCTDTHVGGWILFLNGQAVAVVFQGLRKANKQYDWIGDGQKKTFDHCLGLIEFRYDEAKPITLDEEMDDTFTVEYSSQLLDTRVIHAPSGEDCDVVEKAHRFALGYRQADEAFVTLRFSDGRTERVRIGDVRIPYALRA